MTVTVFTTADLVMYAWTEEFIMIGNYYDPGITPNDLVARHRFKPINDIPREEMLKRDSFGNAERLNNNRYLTAWLNQRAKK